MRMQWSEHTDVQRHCEVYDEIEPKSSICAGNRELVRLDQRDPSLLPRCAAFDYAPFGYAQGKQGKQGK